MDSNRHIIKLEYGVSVIFYFVITIQGEMIMNINPVNTSGINLSNKVPSKANVPSGPQDSFTHSGGKMQKIGLSAEDISRLLLDKKTGDAMKEVKDKQDFIEKIHRQIEAAAPEFEELEKQGIIDGETAKSILLNGGQDPHVHNCIATDGDLSTKPIVRKDGSFVVGGGDGITMKYLTAYSPSGKGLWRSKDLIDKQPVMDAAGNFYFAKNQGTVSYDKDGNRRWQLDRSKKAPGYKEYVDASFVTGDCSGSSGVPAIDEKRNTMYMGEWYGKFFAVDKDSGEVKWVRIRDGMIGTCDPTLDKDGNIFFHDDNGHVLSLKPDGSENWILGVGDPSQYKKGTEMIDTPATKLWMKEVGMTRRDKNRSKRNEGDSYAVGTPQILADNELKVVFGTRDGRLVALNHDTGKIDMFFDAKDAIYNTPLDAGNGKLVFATSEGHLFCVDTKNTTDTKYGKQMTKLWDMQLDKYANPEMVDEDGKIYVSSSDKGLMVLNPDGSKAWGAAVNPQTGIIKQADGSLLITERENILEIRPLANRVEELKKEGKLVKNESTGKTEEVIPGIEQTETTVNIGGVVLKKNK